MTIEFHKIDEKLLEPAFELATEVFINRSTLHKALRIGLDDYRTYIRPSFEGMVAEGYSIAAVDIDTGTLIGCMIVTDFFDQLKNLPDQTGVFAALGALTHSLRQQYLQKDTVQPGEALLIDMGIVADAGSGRGIYQQMRALVQVTAREAGYRLLIGELSSYATQHVVLEKLGHRKRAEIAFDTFRYGEDFPFRSITEPKSIILAEGSL
ncbi:MAG: hypothetical protein AAF217_15255 [Pseudomonadota bacterium]